MHGISTKIGDYKIMYYQDLSFYRTGGDNGIYEVYPYVVNVGWLDPSKDFSKGIMPAELVQKLKEIIYIDIKNQDDVKSGKFKKSEAVIVDQMLVRGSPYECQFCGGEVISISPSQVFRYSGDRDKVLGLNEVCIPSEARDIVYSCPTLICHYIEKHGYLPPGEFIEDLEAFDLNKPYDLNEDKAFDFCVDVPEYYIDGLTSENVFRYPESEEC